MVEIPKSEKFRCKIILGAVGAARNGVPLTVERERLDWYGVSPLLQEEVRITWLGRQFEWN